MIENFTLYRKRYENVEADRNTYIGGSDMGTILGLNPWKSAYALWLEKTGQVEVKDISDNEAVWWGTNSEDLVARRFAMKAREAGKRLTVTKTSFEFRCKEYPFLVAHIDRSVMDYHGKEFDRVGLECKTTSSWNRTDYEEGDIPASHYAQVQFYMAMTNSPYWYYAVKRDSEFFWCRVDRNEPYIDEMLARAIGFWNHVETGEPVEIDGSEATAKALAEKYAESVDSIIEVSSEADTALFEAYTATTNAIKELNAEKERIGNQIRERLGENQIGKNEGFSISWKPQTKNTVNRDALIKDHPELKDIIEEYTKETTIRVLRVARKKVKKA